MPGAIQTASPFLDEPGRRLAWVAPLAIAIWIAVLLAFGFVLQRTAPPPPELQPVEARIVEIPPPAAGLQGGHATAPHPAAPPAAAKPRPQVKVHRRTAEVRPHSFPHAGKVAPSVEKIAPKAPASIEGARKEAPAESSAGAKTASTGPSAPGGGAQGKTGSGSGAGPGSDSLGARAIYSPAPEIPDDLREETFNTEAVAHFDVSYDGKIKVTLVKPTANPRLNEILLSTLQQWRFFPAMKGGVAVDSSFDVRIPIAVQ